jgi:hypothetical protein
MRRALAPVALLLTACTGKDPYNPGTPIGTFHVTGTLAKNECTSAPLPSPWDFDVKLSRDGTTLYWIQGGLPVQGHLDATSHTTMSSSDSRELRAADPQHNIPTCTVRRDDTLDATLGPDPVASFTGALGYTFTPTDDSDCSDQLESSGGGFTVFPCGVSYAITGTKVDRPPQY